jgi:hypothetical protein
VQAMTDSIEETFDFVNDKLCSKGCNDDHHGTKPCSSSSLNRTQWKQVLTTKEEKINLLFIKMQT